MDGDWRPSAEALFEIATGVLAQLGPIAEVNGQKTDFSKLHSRNFDVRQLVEQMVALAEILKAAVFDIPAPSPQQNSDLLEALSNAVRTIHVFELGFAKTIESGGGPGRVDYVNRIVFARDGQGTSVEQFVEDIARSYDQLVRAWNSVAAMAVPRKSGQKANSGRISELLAQLQSLTAKAEEAVIEIQSLKNEASAQSASISEKALGAFNNEKQIAEELSRAQAMLGQFSEVMGRATTLKAQGDDIGSQISAVKEALAEFSANFTKRREDAETDAEKMSEVLRDLIKGEERVERVIVKAEAMLKGATVAGLAKTFADMDRKLNWSVRLASFWIYVLTILTAIAALPLALPVLPSIGGLVSAVLSWDFTKPIPAAAVPDIKDGYALAAYIATRAGLILPFAVLLAFSIARHNALFRLRQHYAFKYSIAMSVEGFKQQAPDYEQEIAAMALDLVAFNPAERLRGQASGSNRLGRLYLALREKLLTAAEKRLSKEPDKPGA